MSDSWDKVRLWLKELRTVDAATLDTGLSAEGARMAWATALESVTPEVIDRVEALGGLAYPTASFVAAATVFSAPIEWLAILLGHGSSVQLKYSVDQPGPALLFAELAHKVGLPLEAHADRGRALTSDLVIAMGSDETMEQISSSLKPGSTFLGHGHKFSLAWITKHSSWELLARDSAYFDTRGCFSPQVALTTLPLEEAVEGLAEAMREAQDKWPVGLVGDGEAARIRSRGALARITGVERHGPGWSVHGLPAKHWQPGALPRSLVVIAIREPGDGLMLTSRYKRWLSTVGSDDVPTASVLFSQSRVVEIGRMQRPEVFRLQDGRDWIGSVAMSVKDWR